VLPARFLEKHQGLYGRHAAEILERRDALVSALWGADRREEDGTAEDPPLEEAQRRIAELEAAIADLQYQVSHLKSSLSWRLTEPVRAALRFLARRAAPTPPR
jgi:hypothetical protein